MRFIYMSPGDVQYVTEANLPHNQSHYALTGHIMKAVKKAHGVAEDSYNYPDGPYHIDTFPGHVVYSYKGETLKRPYTTKQGPDGADPLVMVGDHKKVHSAYVDNKEGGSVLLSEGVVNTSAEEGGIQIRESITFDETVKVEEGKGATTIPIKIIAPGWGSMAYYSKEVLQRDGPKVFKKGTHMYWNHATDTEEAERPEGDLNNLAAVLTSDAVWEDNGVKGPGLYSKAKVFSDYASQVDEKGAHIGISINAGIKAHEGEMEGRAGRIADKFVIAYSTDFVTKAGAGGAPIVPVSESAREPQSETKEITTMTEAEIKAMQDKNTALEAQLKTMEAGQNHILAVATVGSVLTEAGIEYSQKMLERACTNPIMKDGKPDPDWVKTTVGLFTEGHEGRVRGLGGVKEKKEDLEADAKRFSENLKELGVPEAGLAFALKGRV